MTKLYEISKGSKIRVVLEDGLVDNATFHHLDGAYSYCTTSKGAVFHLSANTPLKWSKGGYYYIIS